MSRNTTRKYHVTQRCRLRDNRRCGPIHKRSSRGYEFRLCDREAVYLIRSFCALGNFSWDVVRFFHVRISDDQSRGFYGRGRHVSVLLSTSRGRHEMSTKARRRVENVVRSVGSPTKMTK